MAADAALLPDKDTEKESVGVDDGLITFVEPAPISPISEVLVTVAVTPPPMSPLTDTDREQILVPVHIPDGSVYRYGLLLT